MIVITDAHKAIIKKYYKSFPGDQATLERLYEDCVNKIIESDGIIPHDAPEDIKVRVKERLAAKNKQEKDEPKVEFMHKPAKEKKVKKAVI